MTRPPLAGAVGVADWGWSRLYPGFIVATDFDHPQSASADSPASEANTQPRGYAWPLPAVT